MDRRHERDILTTELIPAAYNSQTESIGQA